MSPIRRSTRLALATSSVVDCGAATVSLPLKRDRSIVESHDLSNITSSYTSVSQNSDLRQIKDDDEVVPPLNTPKRKKKRLNALKRSNEDERTNVAKKSRGKNRASQANSVVEEIGGAEVETPKPSRKRKPMVEPVYIIPDVEIKTTTFKGRLESLKKNGIGWVKELGKKNVEDLLTMIQWNEDNKNIRFLRISSEMFPFASHGDHGYSLDYCHDLLAEVGILANKYGHRLTTHPGQFTQLGSPRSEVLKSSIRELEYHCEMLDRMGIGVDGVMVIHGGGIYDDKAATIERIKRTVTELLPQNVRNRLVLENDELCYNAEELLQICEELDIPLVFDYHHDALNPSSIPPSAIIQRANAIFARRGIRPKQHLSEPRPGAETLMEKRAHSDRCQSLPVDLPDDMDLMIEVIKPTSIMLYKLLKQA
ncbi:hypothetical protein C0992_009372 [Termitomyces sp. T32_za158]|nr:hypothetical protein C0992_009372 [Termitomyces sp. T32_za158]